MADRADCNIVWDCKNWLENVVCNVPIFALLKTLFLPTMELRRYIYYLIFDLFLKVVKNKGRNIIGISAISIVMFKIDINRGT